MKKLDVRFTVFVVGMLLNILAHVACEQTNEDGSGAATLTGSFSSVSSSSKIAQSMSSSLSIADYYVYCVSFEDSPKVSRGEIGSDGSFSLEIPFGVPVGCFVNSSSTNLSVANFVIKDSGAGTEDSSIAVNSSVNLGQLNLNLESGEVEVPRDRVEENLHEVTGADFDADAQLHNQAYTMTCVLSGDATRDAACDDMVSGDGGSVYFRVLHAVEDGENVEGLGVWKDQAAFQNCGSIDMTDAEKSDIESDGVAFTSSLATASNYESDTSLCPLRDNTRALGRDNLENYFALGKLENEGGYREMRMNDSYDYGSGCTRKEKTEIHFQPKSDGVFLGHFVMKTHWEESSDGACGSRDEEVRDILIKFTRD